MYNNNVCFCPTVSATTLDQFHHPNHHITTCFIIIATNIILIINIIITIIIMDFNSTESWLLINTSFPTLPVIGSGSNRSGMEAYLQRLAHLDEGLYHDFYGLWIALMVINSLIFMVGIFWEHT